MNLRHIDPRSTDWMDAMLEGESVRKRKPDPDAGAGAEGQGQGQRVAGSDSPPLLAAAKAGEPESLGSPPGSASIAR